MTGPQTKCVQRRKIRDHVATWWELPQKERAEL